MGSGEKESLNRILHIIFKRVSSKDILDDKLLFDQFDRCNFFYIAGNYLDHLSGDEIQNLYNYLVSEIDRLVRVKTPVGGKRTGAEETFNVLEVLSLFNRNVLTEIEGMPVCRYDHLLRWRQISFELEEDLFTTSYLAELDNRRGWHFERNFNWKSVIGNDNTVLNNILKKGLSENHFHLKGSAPYFAMSWINLMNFAKFSTFANILRRYDKERRDPSVSYHSESSQPSLVCLYLQAATIRAFLFSVLTDQNFDADDGYCFPTKAVWDYFDFRALERIYVSDTETISDIISKIGRESKESGNQDKKFSRRYFLRKILRRLEETQENLNESRQFTEEEQAGRRFIECMIEELDFCEDISWEEIMRFQKCGILEIIKELLRQTPYIKMNARVIRCMVKEEERKELRRKVMFFRLKEILGQEQELLLFKDTLVQQIRNFCTDDDGNFNRDCRDYMLWAVGSKIREWEPLNGERFFMYAMFRGLYQKNPNLVPYGNLFYAYLIIKENIRSELIQVNQKVGFDNFLRYQNRKEEFIDSTSMTKIYTAYAVRNTLEGQSMHKLEARITPRRTARENREYIRNLDRSIGADKNDVIRRKVFYVFHFVKEPEKANWVEDGCCRNYHLRAKIARQAKALEVFRERYQREASRVYGIDACSPEIGCRPEVFAQAFRFLKTDQIFTSGKDDDQAVKYRLPRLGCTYHVGEDFLDIVDGMRAIDEAVFFLNLSYGDRLGHALALGVSPVEWYHFKRNRVLISKQDNLDNIVWAYEKIRKYNIPDTQNLLLSLERQFTHCFQDIYGKSWKGEIDIDNYYDAWKLRGDAPELYSTGEYNEAEWRDGLTEWQYTAINNKHEELDKIRLSRKCTELYYLYHYDSEVKKVGSQIVERKISPELMLVVEQIQRCLQREIADGGLCIETNPSSNVSIGTFGRYDKHPICKWYNKGLTNDLKALSECPQIDVTINTDDLAVFGTSLENEYALMAIALQKVKDETGKSVYNINMIYDWLNNIRRIGNFRCFNQEYENEARGDEEDQMLSG